MNISHFRFIPFDLKIFGEIVTTIDYMSLPEATSFAAQCTYGVGLW